MTVKQLTITMTNKPGQLASISEILGDAGVNILAFFVSTATGTATELCASWLTTGKGC